LGTLFLLWGINRIIYIIFIPDDPCSNYYEPIIGIVVGIGLLTRDHYFGLWGSLFFVILTLYHYLFLSFMSKSFGFITSISIIPIIIFIILFILRNDGFRRNIPKFLVENFISFDINKSSHNTDDENNFVFREIEKSYSSTKYSDLRFSIFLLINFLLLRFIWFNIEFDSDTHLFIKIISYAFLLTLHFLTIMAFVSFEREYKKYCTSCNKLVYKHSSVGDKCPHCGEYWGSQKSFTI